MLVAIGYCQQTTPPETEVVKISFSRSDAYYRNSKITLACESNVDQFEFTFWRRLNGRDDLVVHSSMQDAVGVIGKQILFEMIPEAEGVFYCRHGNTSSINEVEIVGK